MAESAEDLIARLRKNPSDSEAFAALRAHYYSVRDYGSVVQLLEGWAVRTADAATASQALFEAAGILAASPAERERAIALYFRALERNPAHQGAADQLQGLFEASGQTDRVVDLLERRGGALAAGQAAPETVANVHEQLGEILQTRLGRSDRAAFHYRKAFEFDATRLRAIYNAREIYRTTGNFRAAAALYELEAQAETDRERKLALWRELAHLCTTQLGDFDGALQALRAASAVAPQDTAVLHELAVAHLGRAGQPKYAATAERDRQGAADILCDLARRVPADLALRYLQAALDACPDHVGSLQLLERLLDARSAAEQLPARWLGYLERAPEGPLAQDVRLRLARAYIGAGQPDDAIVCLEPMLNQQDAKAAALLVDLYRNADREDDLLNVVPIALAGLSPSQRLPYLREAIPLLVLRGDTAGAAAYAREILAVDPADPEALAFLEADLRARGDWTGLRTLLLEAARTSGSPASTRAARLREVALLCANRLADPDGALAAWRGVIAVDPGDTEARGAVRALLERSNRWADLAALLEQEAALETDTHRKADIQRELAEIFDEQLDRPDAAAAALAIVLGLEPTDLESRDHLCDLLLTLGQYAQAVPILRERAAHAESTVEKVRLLRSLAAALEEGLRDLDGAFAVATQLLDFNAADLDALDRMERIDVASGRTDRLLETLAYRAGVLDGSARGETLAAMGVLALEKLGDSDRATGYFAQALEQAAEQTSVLDRISECLVASGRTRDLVALLRSRAKATTHGTTHAELFRRIARLLGATVRNPEAATEAWREVLTHGDDLEALRYLCGPGRAYGSDDEVTGWLEKLQAVSPEPSERVERAIDRAELLASRSARVQDAIQTLRSALAILSPPSARAAALLAKLATPDRDPQALAEALDALLATAEQPAERIRLASRLADLFETSLPDPARAEAALRTWAEASQNEPAPLRRLVRVLRTLGKPGAEVETLDQLATKEPDPDTALEALLRAAEVCASTGDVDGASRRLLSAVKRGSILAQERLRDLARERDRSSLLAEQYVAFAQETEIPAEQARAWLLAATLYDEDAPNPGLALEATLRAFALDLDNLQLLDQADRLATKAAAWPRLAQVYDSLLRRARTDEAKVQLLVRHATVLDRDALDPSAALDRLLRACALAPLDDTILDRAEDLAHQTHREQELLIAYDRRRAAATTDDARVEAILRAAFQCYAGLHDSERAAGWLHQAVRIAAASVDLLGAIEATADELDRRGSEQEPQAALRIMTATFERVAGEVTSQPEYAANLLRRAARLHRTRMANPATAFKLLQEACTLFPAGTELLDELEAASLDLSELAAVERLYEGIVAEVIDPVVAAELLRRRARILVEDLDRIPEAALVFRQLLAIAPHDTDAAERLRTCLRSSGRHHDLLLALEQEIDRATDPEHRVVLLKEIAVTWEQALSNRWEALEAWSRVARERPGDPEATEALRRLGHSTRRVEADDISVEARVTAPSKPVPPSSAPPPVAAARAVGLHLTGEHTDPGTNELEKSLEGVPAPARYALPAVPAITELAPADAAPCVTQPHTPAQRRIHDASDTGPFADTAPSDEITLQSGDLELSEDPDPPQSPRNRSLEMPPSSADVEIVTDQDPDPTDPESRKEPA